MPRCELSPPGHNKVFFNVVALRNHVAAVHEASRLNLVCSICPASSNRRFVDQVALAAHMHDAHDKRGRIMLMPVDTSVQYLNHVAESVVEKESVRKLPGTPSLKFGGEFLDPPVQSIAQTELGPPKPHPGLGDGRMLSFLSVTKRYELHGRACCHCGEEMPEGYFPGRHAHSLRRATKEHVIPKALGGIYGLKNVLFAHADCNSRRGSRPPSAELLQKLWELNEKTGLSDPTFKPPFDDLSGLLISGQFSQPVTVVKFRAEAVKPVLLPSQMTPTHYEIRAEVTAALKMAKVKHRVDPEKNWGPVNWNRLGVVNVMKTNDETGQVGWIVVIREALSIELEEFIRAQIGANTLRLEVRTEW